MKDYSVLDNMIRMVGDTIKQALDKGYKQGYEDGIGDGAKSVKSWDKACYEQGLNDAWEAARIIYGMNKDTRLVTTAFVHYETVFDNYSASEAISRIKEYKEKQADDKIRVGDEVKYKDGGKPMIILRKTRDLSDGGYSFDAMYDDGTIQYDGTLALVQKTGRHFSQIEDVLEQMREGWE